jgi:hypothetical protein
VGVGYSEPPQNPGTLLSPANRTDWRQLKSGMMIEPFATAGLSAPPHGLGCFDALTRRDTAAADSADPSTGFNFTAAGFTAAQEAVERAKWSAALEFYSTQGLMDLAYDGFFRTQVRKRACVKIPTT